VREQRRPAPRRSAGARELRGPGEGGGGLIGEILVEATRQVAAAVVARADGRDPEWLMPTGLLPLDRLIGGLYRGKLHVVAGRPSMGKSTLARTFAGNRFAAGDGVHVFSLEDDRIMYGLRVLADEGRVNLQRLVQARITPDELSAVTLGADRVIAAGADRWRVDDSAGISADKIAMAVRRHKRTLNTKLVVVDYAQILHEPDERERRQQIRRSAQVLHDLARDEGVAVVLVAQLNRGPERRDNHRPIMADLDEAGALEQLAYAIMFLYRDEVYNRETAARGEGEVIVAKIKQGPTGTAALRWDRETATYRNPGSPEDLDWGPNGPPADVPGWQEQATRPEGRAAPRGRSGRDRATGERDEA
jgi:replicative DNA helicase